MYTTRYYTYLTAYKKLWRCVQNWLSYSEKVLIIEALPRWFPFSILWGQHSNTLCPESWKFVRPEWEPVTGEPKDLYNCRKFRSNPWKVLSRIFNGILTDFLRFVGKVQKESLVLLENLTFYIITFNQIKAISKSFPEWSKECFWIAFFVNSQRLE